VHLVYRSQVTWVLWLRIWSKPCTPMCTFLEDLWDSIKNPTWPLVALCTRAPRLLEPPFPSTVCEPSLPMCKNQGKKHKKNLTCCICMHACVHVRFSKKIHEKSTNISLCIYRITNYWNIAILLIITCMWFMKVYAIEICMVTVTRWLRIRKLSRVSLEKSQKNHVRNIVCCENKQRLDEMASLLLNEN